MFSINRFKSPETRVNKRAAELLDMQVADFAKLAESKDLTILDILAIQSLALDSIDTPHSKPKLKVDPKLSSRYP